MLKHFFSILMFLSLCGAVSAQSYVPVEFRVLDAKVDVNWSGDSFGEVVKWMREDVGWNVVVRWNELKNLGVDAESVISLKLDDVPVHVALDECLIQLSDQITYHVTPHLVCISTKADFDKRLYTRVYPVGELLVVPLDEEAPPVDLRQMISSPARSFPLFPRGDVAVATDDRLAEAREEVEGMVKMLEPESWKCNGGKGSISWLGQYLIVRNTIEVHEAISGEFSL